MRLLNIKACGFNGLRVGLGVDEVEVNLSELKGLIAISGKNGSGKSTFLELLQPYRSMLSRKGQLHDHVFLRNSIKDLTVEFGGHKYRLVVNVDAKTKTSEGFIYVDDDPISIVDGKLREYDAYVNEIFGSKPLFTSSVFCAQGSRPISDMRTGEFKSLVLEMLPIDVLAKNEATANDCAKTIKVVCDQIKSTIDSVSTRLSNLSSVEEEKAENDRLMKIETSRKHDIMATLDRLAIETTDAKILEQTNELKIERKNEIEQSIRSIKDEYSENVREIEVSLAKMVSAKKTVESEIARQQRGMKHVDQVKKAKLEIPETQARLDIVKADIERLSDEMREIEREMAGVSAKQDKVKYNLNVNALRVSLKELESEKAALWSELRENISKKDAIKNDPELSRLANEITTRKKQMLTLTEIDPVCVSTTCKFIVDAYRAKTELPNLQVQFDAKKASLDADKRTLDVSIQSARENVAQIIALIDEEEAISKSERIALEDQFARLSEIKDEFVQRRKCIKNDIAKLENDSRRCLNEIEKLHAFIQSAPDIEKIEYEISRLEISLDGLDEKIDELTDRKTNLACKHERVLADMKKRLSVAEGLIDSSVESKLEKLKQHIVLATNELGASEEKIRALTEEATRITMAIQKKIDLTSKYECLSRQLANGSREQSQWVYLKNALSKNGLQALEIAGAAPLIAFYANELLSYLPDKALSVELVTQDPETGAEILDVIVTDGDRRVLLGNMCGGEKVFILKAIRLAMTLVAKKKSGKKFTTCLADEEDGALDSENSEHFIHMYRNFMRIGEFEVVYFISHRAGCLSMADHMILFNGNKIEIS